MFVHHVLFWLKDSATQEDSEKLLNGLRKLEAIESIETFHIGIPASTDRPVIDRSYSFSLLQTFKSQEDHDIYQVHSVHKKFIEECSSLWSKVVIYDSINA